MDKKNYERLLFAIPVLVLVLISVLDLTGLLDKYDWFNKRIPTLILLSLSSTVAYWLSEQRKKQEQLNDIQNLIASLSGNITVIEAAQAMDYLSQKFSEAQKTIKQAALAPSLGVSSYANYDKKLNQVLKTKKNVKYLHVVTLDKTRWKRVNEKISDTGIQNYFVKYYDLPDIISSLFLSYAILDDQELVMRYPYMPHQSGMWLSIKNPDIVKLFVRYFDNLWEQGQLLEKNNLQLLQKFNEMYNQ
jgi:hypothetical protein